MNLRNKLWATVFGGLATVAVIATAVHAAGFFTNGVPVAGGTQYPLTLPLTGNETVPADTNLTGGLNPASEAITTNQLAGFVTGLPSQGNLLIGGDATTNLFQRGTTGASQTTTVAYGGPDRWAYWSGTSTAMTVSRDSTATDVPTGFQYAFKMARTASQTGVVQMCMAQEVETANAISLAGQTAELDFNAYTGANFSAAASTYNMTAYIVYGTSTDEGISKLAYGLNAGGGGSAGWTGQANATAAVISLGGVSTAGRYAAFANIPATATEVAVALCYTPTGTAGTNDYLAFAGIQLKRSPQNASYVSATAGYNVTSGVPAAQFERRTQAQETAYQQRYAYNVAESGTAGTIQAAAGYYVTATTCLISIPFPVTMRAAPTYTNSLSATTFKIVPATTAVVLATPFSATSGANTPNNASIVFTTTSETSFTACNLISAAGGGTMLWSAEL